MTALAASLGAPWAAVPVAGASDVGRAPSAPTVKTTVKMTIKAGDFTFSAPKKIRAGLVRVKIVNNGGEPHQAQVARLHDGVTFEQLEQATATSGDDAAILALVDVMGGPNGVEPGSTASVLDELGPGSYALICFIRSADGVSHYARGMVAAFTVTEAKGKAARPPKPKAEITMNEFGYVFPDRIPRRGVVSVHNVGAQDHELGLFRVDAGATLDEARQGVLGVLSADGTPVVHEAGGIVGLEPGATGYVELDLEPGRYVAVCFFPDPTKGNVPHLLEGMFQELEVE